MNRARRGYLSVRHLGCLPNRWYYRFVRRANRRRWLWLPPLLLWLCVPPRLLRVPYAPPPAVLSPPPHVSSSLPRAPRLPALPTSAFLLRQARTVERVLPVQAQASVRPPIARPCIRRPQLPRQRQSLPLLPLPVQPRSDR